MIELTITGRVSKDVIIKDNYSMLTVAVVRSKDNTEFITVFLREKLAEVAKLATKGTMVLVRGLPSTSVYTSKDGTHKSSLSVNASKFELLGFPRDKSESEDAPF